MCFAWNMSSSCAIRCWTIPSKLSCWRYEHLQGIEEGCVDYGVITVEDQSLQNCVHLVDRNKIVSQKGNTFAEKRSCWSVVMTMDEIWQVSRTWRRNTNDWKLNWRLMSQLSRLCKRQQRSWWMSPILVFLKLNRLVSNSEILQDWHLL